MFKIDSLALDKHFKNQYYVYNLFLIKKYLIVVITFSISVYINNIFSLFDNGIYEVGSILEDFFTKSFKLGGCQLDCNVFFGNYEKTFTGMHRDVANLSFVYTDKEMLLCDFDLFEAEANSLSLQKYKKSARNSRSFFFPAEYHEQLFEKAINSDCKYTFKKGDVLKAASWAAPALNQPRGNVLEGNYPMQWTGPLYLR